MEEQTKNREDTEKYWLHPKSKPPDIPFASMVQKDQFLNHRQNASLSLSSEHIVS
jgi:hypothetical protein